MIIENQAREQDAGQEEVHTSKPLAQWQLEVIKRDCQRAEPAPTSLKWNPKTQAWEQGLTPDEAVLRRRYRKAEGFKPEPVIKTDVSGVYVNGEKVLPKPVVYPGGEE